MMKFKSIMQKDGDLSATSIARMSNRNFFKEDEKDPLKFKKTSDHISKMNGLLQ